MTVCKSPVDANLVKVLKVVRKMPKMWIDMYVYVFWLASFREMFDGRQFLGQVPLSIFRQKLTANFHISYMHSNYSEMLTSKVSR